MTRRELLAGGVAMMAGGGPQLVYVGSYSSPKGPEGSTGNGDGIYLFEMNAATGALKLREVFRNPLNPSWLALDRSKTRLYSANEMDDGSVGAYAVEAGSGRLTLLGTQSSGGAGPCHLSLHPGGKHVLVANYFGGTVAVLPIGSRGEVGAATDVKRHQGKVGPARAASGPPGSFAISGHDKAHAHMIQSDASGRFVLAADLGLDQIVVYRFDAAKGKLTANDPAAVQLPPGDGPRHFAFHPNGRWVYSLQEEASTLAVFDYEAARGRLTARQTVSTLPKGFGGTDFTSEVRVSGDGRFVYAANRLHDSIAWFAVGADGGLTWRGEEWTRGDYPRSFTIDPSGRWLYSCNQRSDAVACFAVDGASGGLRFTGQYTPVGTPAVVVFL